MARLRFRNGRWWTQDEVDQMMASYRASQEDRPVKAPMVIRDHMDSVMNPVNGQLYDSKRAFERDVRQAGCVIMGNDAPTTFNENPGVGGIEQDIKTAIDQLGGL